MALELQGVVLNLLWVPGSQSLEGEGMLVTAELWLHLSQDAFFFAHNHWFHNTFQYRA